VHLAQGLRQVLAEGQTFVGQVVQQRLPAAVSIAAAQHPTDESVHFGGRQSYTLLGE